MSLVPGSPDLQVPLKILTESNTFLSQKII